MPKNEDGETKELLKDIRLILLQNETNKNNQLAERLQDSAVNRFALVVVSGLIIMTTILISFPEGLARSVLGLFILGITMIVMYGSSKDLKDYQKFRKEIYAITKPLSDKLDERLRQRESSFEK